MAATTRATSPGATEPFPPLEPAPRTPTSLPGGTALTTLPTISEHSVLLRPTSQVSPKLDKLTPLSPRRSPAVLTGAAAMADAKRKRQHQDRTSRETTPNPAVAAMQSLMGGGGISKPTDAPEPNKLSEPLRKAAEHIHIPDRSSTTSAQTSPVSLSSFGTMDQTNGNGGAMTATSAGSNDTISRYVAEPADMMDSAGQTPATSAAMEENDSNKAFSYPGPPPTQPQNNHEPGPARGMSLPGVGYQDSAKSSPANKRHKCPYCATDFTRHHNLKSHLLTHSQEKPYVCNTCQARFRRLHDLKRHTKLHTGERPHTCDKCGRRFARGDALARHNKGPGGCAGRRSSFGGDDDLGDADGMDGVEYTNDDMDEDTAAETSARRVSEPSRKRVHVETPNDPSRSVYRQHSSTYPPIQHRPGDMGPPAVVHPNNNTSSTSPRDMTSQTGSSYFQNYNQHTGAMTESPKPLSPGQPPDGHRLSVDHSNTGTFNRNRSPSLTTQFQQTHFGRGSISRTPPQPPQAHMGQSANQLPPLTLSTSAAGRPSLAGPGPSMLHHQQVPPQQVSGPSSASSHGQSSGSSMRDILGTGPGGLSTGGEADLWSHLRQLEGKFVRMQDEYELRISRLQEEVISLRSQLNNGQGNGQAGSYPAEPRY
ncbi:hypothetical protein AMS68_005588 [Peltaster fructicola]|uniref:C2H2-type domain-containing protein n=1 Tax=Peltaster fructicola TaxID=286661 RepID=A0A6H0XZH4_9PEZI|nr:hypothetical protein AMS68_005588 [Peltaster fructicola]